MRAKLTLVVNNTAGPDWEAFDRTVTELSTQSSAGILSDTQVDEGMLKACAIELLKCDKMRSPTWHDVAMAISTLRAFSGLADTEIAKGLGTSENHIDMIMNEWSLFDSRLQRPCRREVGRGRLVVGSEEWLAGKRLQAADENRLGFLANAIKMMNQAIQRLEA